jgi:hypothetical protein
MWSPGTRDNGSGENTNCSRLRGEELMTHLETKYYD